MGKKWALQRAGRRRLAQPLPVARSPRETATAADAERGAGETRCPGPPPPSSLRPAADTWRQRRRRGDRRRHPNRPQPFAGTPSRQGRGNGNSKRGRSGFRCSGLKSSAVPPSSTCPAAAERGPPSLLLRPAAQRGTPGSGRSRTPTRRAAAAVSRPPPSHGERPRSLRPPSSSGRLPAGARRAALPVRSRQQRSASIPIARPGRATGRATARRAAGPAPCRVAGRLPSPGRRLMVGRGWGAPPTPGSLRDGLFSRGRATLNCRARRPLPVQSGKQGRGLPAPGCHRRAGRSTYRRRPAAAPAVPPPRGRPCPLRRRRRSGVLPGWWLRGAVLAVFWDGRQRLGKGPVLGGVFRCGTLRAAAEGGEMMC